MLQTRAAIKIQRTVRLWLERLDAKRGDMPVHLRPPGLTDDRRVELHKKIRNFREENPVSLLTLSQTSPGFYASAVQVF